MAGKFVLIDETQCRVLSDDEVDEIRRGESGIVRFFDTWPEESDPNYWPTDTALLLQAWLVRVKPRVKPVQIVTRYDLEV